MKNRNNLSEKEIKALLTRLKDDQAQYPPDLLENRRARFLISVPAAGFVIGSKLIYKTILHGIQASAAAATKVILLSVVSIAAVGTTVLVGYNQGWFRSIKDDVNSMNTMTAQSHLVQTIAAYHLAETIGPAHLAETLSQTQTPTFTPSGTITPTITLPGTLTPMPAPDKNPLPEPDINPTNPPNIEPSNTPNIEPTNPGHHYGQTPTPPAKRTPTPPAP